MPDLSGCVLLAALLIFCEDGYVRRAEGGVLASLSEEDNASDTQTSPFNGQRDATVPSSGNSHGIRWVHPQHHLHPPHPLRMRRARE